MQVIIKYDMTSKEIRQKYLDFFASTPHSLALRPIRPSLRKPPLSLRPSN